MEKINIKDKYVLELTEILGNADVSYKLNVVDEKSNKLKLVLDVFIRDAIDVDSIGFYQFTSTTNLEIIVDLSTFEISRNVGDVVTDDILNHKFFSENLKELIEEDLAILFDYL